ncbi:MAG TPA: hypothetical protein VGE01_10340 [Fimbriimonas sp.]
MITYAVSLVVLAQSGAAGGQGLLDSSYQKVRKARSIAFSMTMPADAGVPDIGMAFSYLRGGYRRMRFQGMEMILTPNLRYVLMTEQKQYMKMPAGSNLNSDFSLPGLEGLGSDVKPLRAAGDARLVRQEGKDVYRVPVQANQPGMPSGIVLLIDRLSVMPLGIEYPDREGKRTVFYENFAVDTLAEADFAWSPPADWSLLDQGKSEAKDPPGSSGEDEYTAKLLKVGTVAPDFKAKTTSGSTISLSAQRKGKKATLVNFWFYG